MSIFKILSKALNIANSSVLGVEGGIRIDGGDLIYHDGSQEQTVALAGGPSGAPIAYTESGNEFGGGGTHTLTGMPSGDNLMFIQFELHPPSGQECLLRIDGVQVAEATNDSADETNINGGTYTYIGQNGDVIFCDGNPSNGLVRIEAYIEM